MRNAFQDSANALERLYINAINSNKGVVALDAGHSIDLPSIDEFSKLVSQHAALANSEIAHLIECRAFVSDMVRSAERAGASEMYVMLCAIQRVLR